MLRTHRLGEADRILTIFTRSHGKVRVVAKGVRRTKSRFGARLEPFSHIDVQCHIGRSLDVVTQVETLHAYGQVLCTHWPAWTAGQAILEAADRIVSEDREPAHAHYQLLLGALNALATQAHDPSLILDSYFLRACGLAGYAPSLTNCVGCGEPGPHGWFHMQSGGVMCADCREPGAATPAAEVLELMAALATGDWVTAEAIDPRHRSSASGFTAAHLQWNLERMLRSLPMVDRTTVWGNAHSSPSVAGADQLVEASSSSGVSVRSEPSSHNDASVRNGVSVPSGVSAHNNASVRNDIPVRNDAPGATESVHPLPQPPSGVHSDQSNEIVREG